MPCCILCRIAKISLTRLDFFYRSGVVNSLKEETGQLHARKTALSKFFIQNIYQFFFTIPTHFYERVLYITITSARLMPTYK